MNDIIKYLEDHKENKMANELKVFISEKNKIENEKQVFSSFVSFVINELKQKQARDRILTSLITEAKKRKLF